MRSKMFLSVMERTRKGGELMEFELIEEAKKASAVSSNCCASDIWSVTIPD